jgi:hypothetical protein
MAVAFFTNTGISRMFCAIFSEKMVKEEILAYRL